jgi:LysM repeat protein
MHSRSMAPFALSVLLLIAPASAQAWFQHTVTAGETLTSVAAADGLTVAQVAAANGLSPTAQLITGTTIAIPPQSGGPAPAAAAPTAAGQAPVIGDGDADGDDVGASAGGSTAAPASSGGSYVVQWGDSLSAIAARAGVSMQALAAANGLDPNGVLLAGSVLRLSGGGGQVSPGQAAASQPIGAAALGTAGGPPYPTPETVSSSQVGAIASANGVSPSLASAIGWQESGFNNDLVSNTGAVGVMQIEPGTWDWIQRSLTAGTALNPSSAADNVRGGVLMLRSLLDATGGDPTMAAAGYYQGLASVQANGMYTDTQQYVNDVMALRQQFGGP